MIKIKFDKERLGELGDDIIISLNGVTYTKNIDKVAKFIN